MDGYVRLYHYVPEVFGISNIVKRRLKISEFKDMNDPFELLAHGSGEAPVRRELRSLKQEFGKTVGLLCFSKNYNSPVQWAHYADRHRGMCLGFDVHAGLVGEVNYISGRLAISAANFEDDTKRLKLASDILFSKHESWSYEQEVRAAVRLNKAEKDGLYFLSFNKNIVLKEIIVGASSGMGRTAALALAKEFGDEVDVFKVRPAFRSFDMVRNKSAAGWQ